MWLKNIKTGVEWDISDSEHIKRLLLDKDYEVLEKTVIYVESTKIKEAPTKKPVKSKSSSKKGG